MNNPDVILALYNITSALGYFFVFFRYLIMGIGLIWTILALLNIWGLTTAEGNGQMNKLFPSKSQPTMASAWMQLLIAGCLFILAVNLLPATLFSAILTGSTDAVQTYTVGSYVQNPNADQLQGMAKGLVKSVFSLMGLMAFFRGFLTWWQISQGTSDRTASNVLLYFFFGALLFNIEWVNALIVSIIGYNIFGFFVGK